jgi:hypothetical protein
MAIPRLFLLVLCLLLSAAVPANLSAADQAAINSICPVTGKAVDGTIPPVIVTVGKGERAQRVLIGVADRAAADKVKANPSAYVESAKANRKAP